MTPRHLDVAIVGAGPVGAALAIALADSDLRVAVLEARPETAAVADARTIALSYGSRLILERLGAWRPELCPTAIGTVHVSQAGGLGRTTLTAADNEVPALGYVVGYAALSGALQDALRGSGTDVRWRTSVAAVRDCGRYAVLRCAPDPLTASLVVLADGARESLAPPGLHAIVHDYHQQAVVASVRGAEPSGGTAWERFTPGGPVALLPSGDGWSLVWTVPAGEARRVLDLDDEAFLAELNTLLDERTGPMVEADPRSAFPLRLRFQRRTSAGRVVLAGNAAQTLHPVAGQGFNLGLRDAFVLARLARRARPGTLGSAAMLAAYEAQRRLDRIGGIGVTHGLAQVFASNAAVLTWLRGAGLSALDRVVPARRWFARRMMFGHA